MHRFRTHRACWTLIFFFASLAPVRAQNPSAMHSAYAEKLHIAGVPNAAKVNDHLYRGAQPTLPAFADLKQLGVTTVVDLRSEHPDTIALERQRVESLGLHFVSIPVGGFSAPGNPQIIQFLSIFRDHPGETVFVHCHYGEDRTGVFVASYRMAVEHWPEEQAMSEMRSFGFNHHWQREMKEYVKSFPARMQSAPDLAAFLKTTASPATSSVTP
jgi:tyrosine-protein phosphatase SIW14